MRFGLFFTLNYVIALNYKSNAKLSAYILSNLLGFTLNITTKQGIYAKMTHDKSWHDHCMLIYSQL